MKTLRAVCAVIIMIAGVIDLVKSLLENKDQTRKLLLLISSTTRLTLAYLVVSA